VKTLCWREDGLQIVRYQKHHLKEAIQLYAKIWAEQNIIVTSLHISQQELLPFLTNLCQEFLEVDFNVVAWIQTIITKNLVKLSSLL